MRSLATVVLSILLTLRSVRSVPTVELEERDNTLKYFKVHAPSENISPAAAALAASLEGQVSPHPSSSH